MEDFSISTMQRQPISSSNLKTVGYDANTQTLEIEFHQGGVYQYDDVPENVYRGLLEAESAGTYFYREIRDNYPTTHLG
jgi:hypothetical protein